jgi:hypothetical protein
MACCMNGTDCPMHKSDGPNHSSKRAFSQAQADSCCAASAQRRDSVSAASMFASSVATALVPVAAVIAPKAPSPQQKGRPLVPLPGASTPKHILLSVLIV